MAWCCGIAACSAWVVRVWYQPVTAVWMAGLLSHWQWVYVTLAGVSLCAAGLSRRSLVIALLPTAVVAGVWWDQAPAAAPREATAPGRSEGTLLVASANLNFARQAPGDHSELQRWLASANAPDVVALEEFTDSASEAMSRSDMLSAYPYRVLEPSPDQFGLAVLSKLPLASVQRVRPSKAESLGTLTLRVVVTQANGEPLAVTAVHPMPPVNADYARERDASIHAEAGLLARSGRPGVLAGDMNDTPWSTGLRGAHPLLRATGTTPTWPNAWGFFSVLPLDHILVTPGVVVLESGLGPDLGSDHRPVFARLRVPAGD